MYCSPLSTLHSGPTGLHSVYPTHTLSTRPGIPFPCLDLMVVSFPPFRSLSKSTSIKRFWPPHLRKHSIPLAYFTFLLNPSCQQTLQQILVYCSPPHMPDHKLLEKRDLTIPFSAYLQGLQQDLAHSSWSIISFGING